MSATPRRKSWNTGTPTRRAATTTGEGGGGAAPPGRVRFDPGPAKPRLPSALLDFDHAGAAPVRGAPAAARAAVALDPHAARAGARAGTDHAFLADHTASGRQRTKAKQQDQEQAHRGSFAMALHRSIVVIPT